MATRENAHHESSGSEWENNGNRLRRTFEFATFLEGIDFVNRVAALAEEINHHPEIEIHWRTVLLESTSHDTGGLTKRDFALAAAIDRLWDSSPATNATEDASAP